ncbi:unnamed protein product [Dracunculus medinensis]|uniref:FGGY_N domain-containing protein n=1 Tax=Dracunculus medinensis TaxID=318479 RepID=A0A0N4U7Z6_DRAME|nr:unnamed protein product [Dracunculus medinensis]
MAICLAIIDKGSTPLYVNVCEKERSQEFDIHMFLYCSLDIVDEKIDGASRSPELFLGPLISDQKYKSFGYITNTKLKMLVVSEIGNTSLKDQDVRAVSDL